MELLCQGHDRVCQKSPGFYRRDGSSRLVSVALTYDATLRNLELIGEAAIHVPVAVREAHPEIPWSEIIALRNRIAHAYLGIDDDIIWSIIVDAIPELILALNKIAEANEAEQR